MVNTSLKKTRRIQQFLFIFGSALILLGSINIIYGHFKTAQYVQAFSDSVKSQQDISTQQETAITQKYLSVDSYQGQIARIKTRIEFYELTMAGGRAFLVVGALFLLGGVALFTNKLNWNDKE